MGIQYQVLLFPEGRDKAFTLSYDDGVTQDRRLVKLFNEYKLKSTFNLNSGKFSLEENIDGFPVVTKHDTIDASEVKELYANHEVAVHGIMHMNLPQVSSGMISYEISGDRFALEELVNYTVRGMAYPFGTYNDEVVKVLRLAGIEYSRTVESTYNFSIPEDFLKWHPTCHHNDEQLLDLVDEFLKELDPTTEIVPKLFYVWGHAYEFDGNSNWDRIETLCKKIAGHDDVWYATNIEIVDYINASKQLRYSANGSMVYNPTCTDIWIRVKEKNYKIPSGETVNIM